MKSKRVWLTVGAVLILGLTLIFPYATAQAEVAEIADYGKDMDDLEGVSGNIQENSQDNTTSPGEWITGALNVQGSEIRNQVKTESLEASLSEAKNSRQKAKIISKRLDKAEKKLSSLEAKKRKVKRKRNSGKISRGTYNSRLALIASEADNIRSTLNKSREIREEVSKDIAKKYGLPESISSLESGVENLITEEVTRSAKIIDGEFVGKGLSDLKLSELVESYNSNLEDAPGVAKNLFGNEKMNVFVRTGSGTSVFYIETKGGKVVESKRGKEKDITLRVYTTESTVRRVKNSESPGKTFRKALENDDILYVPAGLSNKMKYSIASAGAYVVDSASKFLGGLGGAVVGAIGFVVTIVPIIVFRY